MSMFLWFLCLRTSDYWYFDRSAFCILSISHLNIFTLVCFSEMALTGLSDLVKPKFVFIFGFEEHEFLCIKFVTTVVRQH